MNIFFLHYNPKICARWHLDRHVVKMILESAQLLCTAIWFCNRNAPLKSTHVNHPCSVWTRASKNNWLWLKSLALCLCEEYTFRYQREHKLYTVIQKLVVPELPDTPFSRPPLAMPDVYKTDDCIASYRNYYILGKGHLHFWKTRHAWKNRKVPKFIRDVFGEDYGMKVN